MSVLMHFKDKTVQLFFFQKETLRNESFKAYQATRLTRLAKPTQPREKACSQKRGKRQKQQAGRQKIAILIWMQFLNDKTWL